MIQDFYLQAFQCSATAAILTQCKWEIMQAVWQFLLDVDFVQAYKNVIIIKFPDGIFHCVFPQIFTCAANYPEKYISYYTLHILTQHSLCLLIESYSHV